MFFSAILGIIQGITEFLPVSSSAHLIFVSWLMEGKPLPLAVNTALHFGTLIAVLIYFWRDWLALINGSVATVFKGQKNFEGTTLLPALLLGSVPAGFVGILAKDQIEDIFHNPLSITLPLACVGFLLWFIDKRSSGSLSMQEMNVKMGIYIGFAQACALIPGVSRSGATISASRALGLSRDASARFSFLLGTPAMGGAALLHYKDFIASLGDPSFYIGIITSCVVGCLAIRFFLKFISRFGFLAFAIYRASLALLILIIYLY
ncbi:MAG: undecaprenyl-diphosphate phosphatase [Oligoflexales bacterium]